MMKNPEETIRRLNEFANKIYDGHYRINFVLLAGYEKFIDDLRKAALSLVEACHKQTLSNIAENVELITNQGFAENVRLELKTETK